MQYINLLYLKYNQVKTMTSYDGTKLVYLPNWSSS